MDSLTFTAIAFIVGMGGTLLSLVFLSLLIWVVNRLFPERKDKEMPHD
jgi:hypothetical protein